MGAVEPATSAEGTEGIWTKVLRWFLWFIAAESAFFIVIYLYGGFVNDEEFRMVANSSAKDALLAAIAAIGAMNVRRYAHIAVPLLILGHGMLIAVNLPMLLWGADQPDPMVFKWGSDATAFAVSWMAVDAVIIAALFLLNRAAQRELLGLSYLRGTEFRSLRAMADVLIHGNDERVDPGQIARNVDGYLQRLNAAGKGRIRAIFALLSPFALMQPATRARWIQWLFVGAVERHRFPGRKLVRAVIRTAQQFVFLGYYGDPACHEAIDYEVFSKRAPPREAKRRRVKTVEPDDALGADIVVVGSGAAGAILAYRLAERHEDRTVLVLERGPHVDPEQFQEEEVDMYLDLYNEGALQLATSFNFSVLQGMCVGGSTVINNAVCFDAPDEVLDSWNDDRKAGLDLDALKRSFRDVRRWLDVQKPHPDMCNPAGRHFAAGVEKLGLGKAELVDVNIAGCLGCGYCNIGCSHGTKMSMLDKVLPDAQEAFRERVRVLPNCKVEAIDMLGSEARAVVCTVGGRERRITAGTVVVAAGALNSSVLLQNSGLRSLQAGRDLHFNIVSPLTARFETPIHAYRGLQISHYWQPPAEDDDRYVLETWFNPPATQALVMPGWFDEHFQNMSDYAHMGSGGVLVGTTVPGEVRSKGGRAEIDYAPGREDMEQVVAGLKQLIRIYHAGGAECVMPATYKMHRFRPGDNLDVLDRYANGNDGLSLNSAHPQGGNAISSDPRRGVVDPDFRVRGTENVYVCDASVFPTSVTVNPQLTVMALADYAGRRIPVAQNA